MEGEVGGAAEGGKEVEGEGWNGQEMNGEVEEDG